MKKVLILSVIAMLALGVMALAGTVSTTGNGPITTGATCSQASLQVVSNIYVLPGYVATATAYDATFCGATGNLLDGAVLTESNGAFSGLVLGGNYKTSGAAGVTLAQLQIKSNYQNVQVTANVSVNEPSGPQLTGTFFGIADSSSGSYIGSTWELPQSSSPYSGTGYLVANGTSINPWVQAGKYPVTINFTIIPATLNGDGTFSF